MIYTSQLHFFIQKSLIAIITATLLLLLTPIAYSQQTPSTQATIDTQNPQTSADSPNITQVIQTTTLLNTPITISVSDSQEVIVTVILAGNPAFGTAMVSQDLSTITYTPNLDYQGDDLLAFAYQLEGEEEFRGKVVNLSVNPTLIPVDNEFETSVNQNRSNTFTFSQSSLPTQSIEVLQPPVHGQYWVNEENKSITFLPDADYTGTDSITYEYCELNADEIICLTQRINYTINTVESNPSQLTISNQSRIAYDISQPGQTLLSTDRIIEPTNGTVTIDETSSILTYIPNSDFVGTDRYRVRICYQPSYSCAILDAQVTVTE